jgi:hypothetical protein
MLNQQQLFTNVEVNCKEMKCANGAQDDCNRKKEIKRKKEKRRKDGIEVNGVAPDTPSLMRSIL